MTRCKLGVIIVIVAYLLALRSQRLGRVRSRKPTLVNDSRTSVWELVVVASFTLVLFGCSKKIAEKVAIRARLFKVLLLEQIFELRHAQLEVVVFFCERLRTGEPARGRVLGGVTGQCTAAWLLIIGVRRREQIVALVPRVV